MYKLTAPAQIELNDIAIYWFSRSFFDKASTKKIVAAIRAKCDQLGKNPLTGTPIENTTLRVGYATTKMRFAIYYLPRGPRSIEVVMIRDTRQPRPLSTELNSRTNLTLVPSVPPVAAPVAVPAVTPGTPTQAQTATASSKGARKPKTTMAALIGVAPTSAVEYKLFKGMSAALLTKEIEARIEWLQTKAKRLHSAEYKKVAIAYLQEELGKRRRGE